MGCIRQKVQLPVSASCTGVATRDRRSGVPACRNAKDPPKSLVTGPHVRDDCIDVAARTLALLDHREDELLQEGSIGGIT